MINHMKKIKLVDEVESGRASPQWARDKESL